MMAHICRLKMTINGSEWGGERGQAWHLSLADWEKPSWGRVVVCYQDQAPGRDSPAQFAHTVGSDAGGCEMTNATKSESPGVTSRVCGLCRPWLRLPLFQALPALPED